MSFNHMMTGWPGVNTDGPVHYIENGVRVRLEEFDYGDDRGPVAEHGTVTGDLGGESVPVRLDGHTYDRPTGYTPVPRRMIAYTYLDEEN